MLRRNWAQFLLRKPKGHFYVKFAWQRIAFATFVVVVAFVALAVVVVVIVAFAVAAAVVASSNFEDFV